MKQKRLLILLALLMTAATGAWAQDAANLKVYNNALNTPALYNSMTNLDANGDDTNGMYGCWVLQDYATYIYSSQTKDADDWLVTTGIELEAGVTYTIALEAWKPTPQEHIYTETFEVKVGTEATAEALSTGTQVIKTTEVTTSWTNYRRTFTPTTSGTYYVGIHATSPKDQNSFSIRNLSVYYYTLSLADNTKDAGNWKGNVNDAETDVNLPITKLDGGEKVTLKYNGHLKVKAVTATHDGWNGDLSNIPASLIQDDDLTVIVPGGTTLKGTLDVSTIPYKVVIPAGATVTLAGVTIIGTNVNDDAHKHAGITCEGDATIVLKDNTENTVKGFYENYPGIYVPEGKTLIIQGGKEGNGKLTARSNGYAAGIGAGYYPASCGNIEIQGGDITAFGGRSSAGIGGGPSARCGNITISGGTVTATGDDDGAGIGSGSGNRYGANCGAITISGGTVKATGGQNGAGIGSGNGVTCGAITISGGTVEATGDGYAAGIGSGLNATSGNITITDGVTSVTATKGTYSTHSIGEGGYSEGRQSTCGTVTIGGMVYWQNNYAVDDGATYLAQPTFKFVNLSKLTADYVAQDGDVLTNATTTHKVSIAAGATVTLAGVYISGGSSGGSYCIRCLGDATIVLKDGMANTLTSTSEDYPALWAGDENTTLTIKGSTGVLNVKSGQYCAGIGGGYMNTNYTCGNITIEGGVITATGGIEASGIGSDYGGATCGNIIISGGTVTANGGNSAAGIGCGSYGICGDITITEGVKKVTASKGEEAPYSIGKDAEGFCGTVTIGGTLDSDGKPVGGTVYWQDDAAVGNGATYLATNPLEYEP